MKVLSARLVGEFKLEIDFSDHTQGLFDAASYLSSHSGPLLDKLRDASYFSRYFIDAGALCWPNGLEISPAKVHELAVWRTNKDPFLALIGSGNRRNSTDQIMRMTRGDDRSP